MRWPVQHLLICALALSFSQSPTFCSAVSAADAPQNDDDAARLKASMGAGHSKASMLPIIDAAISKADDENRKFALRVMRDCVESDSEILIFSSIPLGPLRPDRMPLSRLPPEIGLFIELKTLMLVGTEFDCLPTEIGKLANLETFVLLNSKLKKLPPEIENLTNLKWLTASLSKLTSLPPEIGALTNLKRLDVGGNRIDSIPPELCKLRNLRELDLSGNPIGDADVAHLRKLVRLKKLNVANTKITREGVAVLQRALPKCNILWNKDGSGNE